MGRDATEQDVFPRREEYDRPRAKRKIKEPERFEIDPHLDDDIMRAPPPAEPELPPPRAWWFERLLLRRHDCGALGCGEGEGASTDDDWHRRVWSRQRPYLTLQGPLTAEDISAGHEAPA
eukprot:TRINITY_DN994_c0_g1_i4.p3 TRINITY_DN994_c0_g1~~TRINITY_DN994_c0_g1_i4.p3  ORF type:complete len:120 (-),score=26.57 TRINITY_DN994_c0_g1_i4:340-699(-)